VKSLSNHFKNINCLRNMLMKSVSSLYEIYLKHSTHLPYLSCQFIPGLLWEDNYIIQKMILGQQWLDEFPNKRPHLLIADLYLPNKPKLSHNYHMDKIPHEDYDEGRIEILVEIPHEGDVNKARCCPNKNNIIATKASNGVIYIFDYLNHQSQSKSNVRCTPEMKLGGHGRVDGYSLQWNSFHQGILLSGSYDSMICMWDVNSAKKNLQPRSRFRCHSGYVEDVAWFPTNVNLFGSVGNDGLMVIWDIRATTKTTISHMSAFAVNCLSFSPHNDMLVSVGLDNGVINFLDLRRLSLPLMSLKGHKDPIRHASFSPHDQSKIATGADDGMVCIWDFSQHQKNKTVNNHSELKFLHGGNIAPINDLVWNPENIGVLASVSLDENSIWKPAENISFTQ
jgi:histone-binding protein RBBP4